MGHLNPKISSILDTGSTSVKSLEYYLDGIIKKKDFGILSEAITLVESDAKENRSLIYSLLQRCLDEPNTAYRIGLTGSPGVGKSTFIEQKGQILADRGHSVAVLSVDPSSAVTKGSILGDRTRMLELSKRKDVFIRPSSSNQYLGGTTNRTFEVLILCEAAGIDFIFIETVGVGQSEIEIDKLADYNILLVLPGAGDTLQGIKKGIVEIADLIVVHKADGQNKELADGTRKLYSEAIHINKSQSGSELKVLTDSSITGKTHNNVLDTILDHFAKSDDQYLSESRSHMAKYWWEKRVNEMVCEKALQLTGELIHPEKQKSISGNDMFKSLDRLSQQLKVSVKLD